MRDRSDASPAGAIFSPAPISAAPGLISPSPLVAPGAALPTITSTPYRLSIDSSTSTAFVFSPSGDESGSAPAIPSISEQPTSVPSLSGDESNPASIITTASFHSGSVPSPSGDESGSAPVQPFTSDQPASVSSPIRDQFGSAFYADEESEFSLSDQESEADANSEADNEAETSFSSSYPDNSHSDPSQPLPQLVVSGADLRIRLGRAIEVYVQVGNGPSDSVARCSRLWRVSSS